MKKILYTLLIGLVVISCNKEDLGSSNAPLSLSQDVAVNLGSRFDAFNDFLRGATFEAPKVESSTAKGGDNGSDWIELIWFQHTSDTYVYTRPEDLGIACVDDIAEGVTNILHETYSYRATTQKVHIQIEGTEGEEFDIPADLQPLYEAAFADNSSAIYFADNASSIYSFREGVLPSVTVND